MLATVTRKLCPLMTLAIATIGCGKKINDADAQPARQTENAEIPSAYVIRLDGSNTSRTYERIPQNAQFKIPERLNVQAGDTANKIVEIAYEVNEYDPDDYLYKCSYKSSSVPHEMVLDKCVDYDDHDFGDVSEQTFTLYRNDIIQMRFTGASASDVVVEAIYSMKWL